MELQKAVKSLLEFIDFLFRASAAYLETDAGRNEWDQFLSALEEVLNRDLNEDGVVGDPVDPVESAVTRTTRVVKG